MRYIWSESYTRTSSYCCGLWNLQFFSCKNKILILKNESQSSQLIQLKLFHYIKSIKKFNFFFLNSQLARRGPRNEEGKYSRKRSEKWNCKYKSVSRNFLLRAYYLPNNKLVSESFECLWFKSSSSSSISGKTICCLLSGTLEKHFKKHYYHYYLALEINHIHIRSVYKSM